MRPGDRETNSGRAGEKAFHDYVRLELTWCLLARDLAARHKVGIRPIALRRGLCLPDPAFRTFRNDRILDLALSLRTPAVNAG